MASSSTAEIETVVADPTQNTPTVSINDVFDASVYGDFEKLRKFVEQDGASLLLPDNNGYYALQCVALNNHPEIVQYIIEHGGDVNALDNSQQTALHLAASKGSISAADVLVHNGAQVEATDVNGSRAVHVAAGYGQTSFLNHLVIKHNADFDVPNNSGRSPLHLAAYYGFVDTVTWLLSRNASKKRQDKLGCTPLHWAARKGKLEVYLVLMDAGTKQEIMMKDNEGKTAIQLATASCRCNEALLLSKALQAECKHLQNSNIKGKDLQKGKNWPMIIAMQGQSYTGKTLLAERLALRLKCPILSLDDFLVASEPTNEKDTLISNTFNLMAQTVKSQISRGFSIIIDSPLSRSSHLQKFASLISTENTHNTRLLIIECKPENEYVYKLRFEESGSAIYAKSWYKPTTMWPLPKVPRDYNDDDIPNGVSKLVVDTNDYYSACKLLRVIFDITSCGYGHIAKNDDYWQFIHMDKCEQFTCPSCNTSESVGTIDDNIHLLTLYEGIDHCDELCGVCDKQVLCSCYTCKHCPLTLHETCAEEARGKKKHFVPESFPRFMSSKPHLTYTFPVERPCAECKKDGKGFSCKCKHCLFESHLKSRLVPTVVKHMAPGCVFTLWLNSDVDGHTRRYTCFACRKYGEFAAYINDMYHLYHPKCLLLPPSVRHSHGGYTHDLKMIIHRVEKEEDYPCECCPNMMDPSAWYYYCSECNFSMHLECAFVDFDSGGPIMDVCPNTCMHP